MVKAVSSATWSHLMHRKQSWEVYRMVLIWVITKGQNFEQWDSTLFCFCPCIQVLTSRVPYWECPVEDRWPNTTDTIILTYAKAVQCMYVVCSNSIRIGIVVVVQWVGCVCNQSWHVHTCLRNSWHKLEVAAFAHLAVVGCGSNVRLCHSDIYNVWKYRTTHLHLVLF